MAKTEFAIVFSELETIQIDEIATMERPDDKQNIVVQIRYSSANGKGVYGFEYDMREHENPELIRHGEEITVENLLQ